MADVRLYNTSVVTEILVEELARQGRGAQSRLARAMGVTPQTVSKWVSGETVPEPERWPALEKHFGMDEGFITGRAHVTYFGREDEVTALRREVAQLRRVIQAVPELRQLLEDAEGSPPDAAGSPDAASPPLP